jgi:hypothetical protein
VKIYLVDFNCYSHFADQTSMEHFPEDRIYLISIIIIVVCIHLIIICILMVLVCELILFDYLFFLMYFSEININRLNGSCKRVS